MPTLVHKADCGCGFSKGDSFYMCAMHKAAPELLAALEGSWQYLVAWRFEYADKPNDEHNNAQRDRIDAQIRKVEAVVAKAKAGKG